MSKQGLQAWNASLFSKQIKWFFMQNLQTYLAFYVFATQNQSTYLSLMSPNLNSYGRLVTNKSIGWLWTYPALQKYAYAQALGEP